MANTGLDAHNDDVLPHLLVDQPILSTDLQVGTSPGDSMVSYVSCGGPSDRPGLEPQLKGKACSGRRCADYGHVCIS